MSLRSLSTIAGRAALTVAAALCIRTEPAAAQQVPRPAVNAPKNWLTAWVGGYTHMGGFSDPADDFFTFDEPTLAFGAAIHRRITRGVLLGVEGTYARPDYRHLSVSELDTVTAGTATAASVMATARLQYGGAGTINIYLTGGAGAFFYDVADLGGWDRDFALTGGAGLEYGINRHLAAFAEFSQVWAYHQKEGVESNTATHNLLRLGIRAGL